MNDYKYFIVYINYSWYVYDAHQTSLIQCALVYAIHHGTEANGLHK